MEHDDPRLRAFCEHVARFVAASAMDPHLYLQHRLVAGLREARDARALAAAAGTVLHYLDTLVTAPAARTRLDRELAAAGLPSVDEVRALTDDA